jgi:hypothetical protein
MPENLRRSVVQQPRSSPQYSPEGSGRDCPRVAHGGLRTLPPSNRADDQQRLRPGGDSVRQRGVGGLE